METRLTVPGTEAPADKRRPSPVIKHSITIAGHKTSVSLEGKFWDGLREIAHNESISLQELIVRIDKDRMGCNLSSSARLFVLNYFKTRSQSKHAT